MKSMLSVSQVASHLMIPRQRVYDLLSSNILPSIRIGRRILIPEDAVDDMLNNYMGETLANADMCRKAYQKHSLRKSN